MWFLDQFLNFWKILDATNAVFNGIPGLSESRQPSHWVTNQIRAAMQDCSTYFVIILVVRFVIIFSFFLFFFLLTFISINQNNLPTIICLKQANIIDHPIDIYLVLWDKQDIGYLLLHHRSSPISCCCPSTPEHHFCYTTLISTNQFAT